MKQHQCNCKQKAVIKDRDIFYCSPCWLKLRLKAFKKEIKNEYRI